MSLISFASAKGSPGVTQTVAGLAAVWPQRVVMADLDPIGGDVALRFRASDGGPLELNNGLVSLGAALRGGKEADFEEHLQTTEGGMHTLVGISSPGQGQGLGATWPHIANSMASYGDDILADCGRFSPGSPVFPVIERSSALIFVVRSEISALAHLRERLLALQEPLHLGAIDAVPMGVILIGDPRDTRSLDDIERLLGSAGVAIPGLGIVADDPKTVRNVLNGTGRNIGRSPLYRSLNDVAERVRGLVVGHRLAQQAAR